MVMLNTEVNVGPHLLGWGFMHALNISMHNHNKNFVGVRNGWGGKWEENSSVSLCIPHLFKTYICIFFSYLWQMNALRLKE